MTAPIVNPLPYDNKTPLGLLRRAKLLKGYTFREILDADPYLTPEQKKEIIELADSPTAKGSLGHLIEEDFFYYNKNPSEEADFPEAGVELKTSPYEKKSNGELRAKERLVLTMINYIKDYDKSFEDSHLNAKCKLMLLIYYYYEKNKSKLDYLINYIDLFEIPFDDLEIIKKDYYTIIQKIKDGKAHEISEGDTLYLGACTKGADSTAMREQPFSDIMAKQRAFCLKNSYMTIILNEYLAKGIHTYKELDINDKLEGLNEKISNYGKAVQDIEELKRVGFEKYILGKMRPYYGRTVKSLYDEFNFSSNAKSKYYLLANRMLGIKEEGVEEFIKAGIKVKTIVLNKVGTPKESMSFPNFEYKEIIKTDYYDSDYYRMFSETKFLFLIFQFTDGEYKNKTGENLIFKKAMFWNAPYEALEGDMKKVREKTVSLINQGDYDHFPKESDNMISHVRPKGAKGDSVFETPQGGFAQKKCFWLNKKYIKEQIEKEDD